MKSSGCIDRHIWKTVRREATSRIRNIIARPALHYGSKTWMLEEDKRRIRFIWNEISATIVTILTEG
jgi:hypothetical protein